MGRLSIFQIVLRASVRPFNLIYGRIVETLLILGAPALVLWHC